MLQAQVLTLFPQFFTSPLSCSIPARAVRKGLVRILLHDIRDFAENKHRKVDDSPYGGGPGMVMCAPPVVAAIRHARRIDASTRVIMLSPSGRPFTQRKARQLASLPGFTLICGRYEGIDERVTDEVDEFLSIGQFVLSGGEPAALCVLDAVIRLLPGALGDARSAVEDSFSEGEMLDYPHYTRPRVFEGKAVPEVLLSGNHEAIRRWRKQQAELRTAQWRKWWEEEERHD